MRRIIFLLALCGAFACLKGQNIQVAILEPIAMTDEVTTMHVSMVRGELRKAISKVKNYDAISRSDLDYLMEEFNFQQSGFVRKEDVQRMGQMYGADYLCISSINKIDHQFYIEAYFIEVNSGQIINPVSILGYIEDGSMADLFEICQSLVKELIGEEQVIDNTPLIEDFNKNNWGWSVFSHDNRSVQIANGQLRITNYAQTGTCQSNVNLPIDISKDFKISFNFIINEAKLLSSVGIKFAGNNKITVNAGTCSFYVGDKRAIVNDAKIKLGRNRPVVVDLIKKNNHVEIIINGIQVCNEVCPFTSNLLSVYAGINTLVMLQDVTIQYIY